jgi:beta-glucosidase
MSFKRDFIWGAAAASYQIEGAWNEDGKGMSTWDHLTEKPGAVYQGHTGKVACDHYHRYKEDIQLMKEMGLKSYRFSISWPRIFPDGTGEVNEAGLNFYSDLVDELIANGIMPFPTLFHWDFPYELHLKGGWLNRDSSDWFAEYTKVVVERLSDRVDHWFTLNEPQVFVGHGHATGEHAPGLKLQKRDIIRIIHNVLMAHGKSVKTIRKYSKMDSKVGMAPVCNVFIPTDETPQSIKVAEEAMFSNKNGEHFSGWSNTWWLDPVYFGKYPTDGLDQAEQYLPSTWKDDLEIISQPVDFLGNNHYSGSYIKANKDGKPEHQKPEVGEALTGFNWSITPEGLYWGPKFLTQRYKSPIIITENGLSNRDWVSLDGKVHDPQRIDFTHRYLREYKKAAADGVDIIGYFHWSVMDNFEWAFGYRERFGLIHIDFNTQKRTIKDSGFWYKTVIESNGDNI